MLGSEGRHGVDVRWLQLFYKQVVSGGGGMFWEHNSERLCNGSHSHSMGGRVSGGHCDVGVSDQGALCVTLGNSPPRQGQKDQILNSKCHPAVYTQCQDVAATPCVILPLFA